jgi:protein disulfide-isomerase A1
LAPEWVKAAKALEGSPMKLAKVDATIAKVLAETHAVQGFPTIKYFKNGKSTEYNGGRVESDIVSWVNKKLGPAYVTVATAEELLNLKEAHESFVLGVFAKVDSDSAKKFIALATESEDLVSYS